MRELAVAIVCLLTLLDPAAAEDKPVENAPPKPLTTEQAADAVLKAIEADDDAVLKALAAQVNPDPWLVADELCYRGEHDAAAAFAKAAPRADVEALPAYIEAWRKRTPDKAERERMSAMVAALRARAPQKAVELAVGSSKDVVTVVQIRLGHVRGVALRMMRRLDESAAVLRSAADAAASLGWLARASSLYHEGGLSAWQGSGWAQTLECWKARLAIAGRRGDKADAATALGNIGLVYDIRGEYAQALSTYERALAAREAVGDEKGVATTLGNMGIVYMSLGNYAKALSTYERALAANEALGSKSGVAIVLGNIGIVHYKLGDFAKALSIYERALEAKTAIGDKAGASETLGNMGLIYSGLGDYAKALSTYERALAVKEALGNKSGVAATLGNIGLVYLQSGDYAKALSTQERALAAHEALGNKPGAATVLGNIGNVHHGLGNFAKALATYERALAAMKALGDKSGASDALINIGNLFFSLGRYAKALPLYERALEAQELLGNNTRAAMALGNIGGVHYKMGDYALALSTHERALVVLEAAGRKAAVASMLGSIGTDLASLGDHAKALSTHERALAIHQALGNKVEAAQALANIGLAHQRLGAPSKARRALERSARAARSLRATPVLVIALTRLARLHLATGKPSRALARAREALRETEDLLGGLGGEQGAAARVQHAGLFAVGTLAAMREEDPAEVLTFLESGRAGALLDTLDKREALRWKAKSLPPSLHQADREARLAENVSRRAYDRAVAQGNLKEIRRAANGLSDATERVREIDGRIQRDVKQRLKQKVALFYPRAKTLYEVQDALKTDQALVLYGLCLDEAMALVVRQDGERLISLGKITQVEAACSALNASDPEVDPAKVLAALKAQLVGPLRLGDDVKQVLISPDGPLCYLPFGALFDQVVAMTPSGTTHVLLLDEEREPGKGILALGNPDYSGISEGAKAIYYRGSSLSPLPATEPEAKGVGTTVLLGAMASEAGLREAVSKSKRWKAVHFACHGLIDVERPMLSSLALSSGGEDDGFLTALEVLRLQIPADLAVLSACETGTGRVVKGEGIVGLTRAFMFAGAPRVICSLWKVDDEATQALMIKFYELWNPKDGSQGLGAAAALKKAQAFVRSQEKWKHPYYWAAWVLWGLPN